MPAPELDRFRKKRIYEGTGSLPEIEQDIGAIRGLDLRAQKWKHGYWLVPLPLILIAGPATLMDPDIGPPVMACSIPFMIALWIVVWSIRRFDVENRRYEFANGVLRLLKLAPQAPLRVGLVLTDMEVSTKIVGHTGGWTYYADPWFFAQGQLADGVGFHYARTGYYDSYYHSTSSRSGNTTTTRTTTRKLWHFDDTLTLSYDPARFAAVGQLGAMAKSMLQLPDAIEVKHFENQPGKLVLVAHCSFKWDATAEGEVKGAVDAVSVAVLLFSSLYRLLGTPPQVDVAAARALPPPRAIAPKAPLTGREYAIVGVSSVLAIAGLSLLFAAKLHFSDSERSDDSADDFKRTIKQADECRRLTPLSSDCASVEHVESLRRHQKDYRESAEEDWDSAIIFSIVGGALTVVGAAGFLFWRLRRKKWIADAEAAGAAMTGPEATPPVIAQQAPQAQWQTPQPQYGVFNQPPPPG